jgi:putative transposase
LDLVGRVFARTGPNQLWMTDITEHPSREGKLYCCVLLDAFSRMVVGWAVDSSQTTRLVLDALGMATRRRNSRRRAGHTFRSRRAIYVRSFSHNVRAAGLAPSMGAVGSPYDNAIVESFWGRMQAELFNRRTWKTRIELASAIHDHIELFHNTRRRHSSLDMHTPQNSKKTTTTPSTPPPDARTQTPRERGQITDPVNPGLAHRAGPPVPGASVSRPNHRSVQAAQPRQPPLRLVLGG